MPMFSGAYEPDPYLANVVLALDMEDTTGDGFTLVDRSVHGNTFTRGGSSTGIASDIYKFGRGSAVFYSNGYYYSGGVNSSLFDMPGDYTIELWIFPHETQSSGVRIISHKTDVNWSEPELQFNPSRQVTLVISGSTRITSSALSTGRWYHVSYGRRNGVNYLYLDGVRQGTWTNSYNLTGWSITIGSSGWQRNTTSTDKYRGWIDELRWWKNVSLRDGVNNFIPPSRPWQLP